MSDDEIENQQVAFISEDDAREILSEQINTYHHIQKLAQSTIRTVIALIAAIAAILTVTGIPDIPSPPSDPDANFIITSAQFSLIIIWVRVVGFTLIILSSLYLADSLIRLKNLVIHTHPGPIEGNESRIVVPDGVFSHIGNDIYQKHTSWINNSEEKIQKVRNQLDIAYYQIISSIAIIITSSLVIFDDAFSLTYCMGILMFIAVTFITIRTTILLFLLLIAAALKLLGFSYYRNIFGLYKRIARIGRSYISKYERYSPSARILRVMLLVLVPAVFVYMFILKNIILHVF